MLPYFKKFSWLAFILLATISLPREAFAQTELTIGTVSQNKTTVNLYDRFEATFDITGTVATNPQWPYDPTSVTGLTVNNENQNISPGITVDGLFLPPGQTNWGNAIIQPAFLFQPTQIDRSVMAVNTNSEWIYPVEDPVWMVRYAPKQKGSWQFKIRVQDKSNYPNWKESGIGSFTVTDAKAGVHGFVQVSQRDKRYFEYSDGTPYTGTGYNTADKGIIHSEQRAEKDFQMFGQNGINFYRIWMSMETVWSRGTHSWDAWKTNIGGVMKNSDEIRTADVIYPDKNMINHDLSTKLSGNNAYIAQYSDGNQFLSGGLEAGKNYKVRLVVNQTSGNVADIVVRLLSSNSDFSSVMKALAPSGTWTVTDLGNGWKRLESSFTNDKGRLLFKPSSALAVGLKASGTVYLDEVYIGEDLGGGKIGPNVVFKGKLNYHQYFDQIASANWDKIIEHAAANGIALKVVINDKQDMILTRIDINSNMFDPTIKLDQHENFHSRRGLKVRRLHEYWWRYLAARWGYSLGVHSWELLNEGNPGGCYGPEGEPKFCPHFDQTNHLAEVIDQLDKNHMATTSFWYGFPAGNFWGNSSAYPSLDYADVHAYTSTGTIIDPIFNDESVLSDAAKYHFLYSGRLNEILSGTSRYMPVVRGEAGIDKSLTNQGENDQLANDKYGVWLHNFTWARMHPGGLYELYWWTDILRNEPDVGVVGPDGNGANGLHEVWLPFHQFMSNVPVNAGGYVNIGIAESGNNRVLGQKNNNGSGATNAHLWIQDTRHKWKTPGSGSLAGTFTITGMKPSTSFPVEWWDFNTKGELRKRTENLTSNASGNLVLTISAATYNGSAIVDTGVKIGTYSTLPSPVPEVPGDANGDELVNTADFKIMIANYAKWLSGFSYGDFSGNGKVNLLDYGIWYKNRTN